MVTAEFLPKKDLKPGWKGAFLEAVLHRKHIAFNGIAYYRSIKIGQVERTNIKQNKPLQEYYQDVILYFLYD